MVLNMGYGVVIYILSQLVLSYWSPWYKCI